MRRTERFGLTLSPAEKAAIAHMAEMEGGLSKAALVRRLIRKAAEERGVWPIPNADDNQDDIEEAPNAADD